MRIPALAVSMALGLAAVPASAGDGYWTSILADFFEGPARTSEFRWAGRVASGQILEVKGVNGAILAGPTSGGDVEIVATRRGRRHDPNEVEIKVVPYAGGVTLCAVYPSAGGRPNECAPGDEGHMTVRNNDVNVDFVVKVPAGVRFIARTVNGAVEATGLGADVDAETVNGSIRIGTSGVARGETVNGSVQASMGRADWTSDLSFKTVNGSIRVTLPASASTTVDAEVVNGSIETDFAVAGGKVSRKRLTGTIGGGGRGLALETVNGSIHISQGAR
jgi:putative adhesin